jgi:hypothetical protein
MLRLINIKYDALPANYPVESHNSCSSFEPGQIAQLKRDKSTNKIVVGPSDGTSFIGIIDDIRMSPNDSTMASGKITVWPRLAGMVFATDQCEKDIHDIFSINEVSVALHNSSGLKLFVSENGKLTLNQEEFFCEPFAELIKYRNNYVEVKII